jgi:cobalt-zinc-cadmium efflux system outer membrane protein
MPIMKRFQVLVVSVLAIAPAERAWAAEPIRLPAPFAADTTANPPSEVKPAVHDMLRQPGAFVHASSPPQLEGESLPPGEPGTFSLAALEQMALANNPAIAQAAAHVTALRGKWDQVGRPPNPTAGYLAEEMGDAGTAGKQGGFVGQDFITGGKLRYNRAIVAQEIQRAEQLLAAATVSTRTDVQKAYYNALVAMQKVEFTEEWYRFSVRSGLDQRRAAERGEVNRYEAITLTVLHKTARTLYANANHELTLALRQLSILIGQNISEQSLEKIDIKALPDPLLWDEQLARITTTSPEAAAAGFRISRAESALRRACAERVPDVSTEFMVQYDNAAEQTITGVRVGLPLPIWNRNQGGIRQAQGELSEAQRDLSRVEDHLADRLAVAFKTYTDAREIVEEYTTRFGDIYMQRDRAEGLKTPLEPGQTELPPEDTTPLGELSPLEAAKQARDDTDRLIRAGDVSTLEVATVYGNFTEVNLLYLDALNAHWASWAEIQGLLLSDSLTRSPHDDFEP